MLIEHGLIKRELDLISARVAADEHDRLKEMASHGDTTMSAIVRKKIKLILEDEDSIKEVLSIKKLKVTKILEGTGFNFLMPVEESLEFKSLCSNADVPVQRIVRRIIVSIISNKEELEDTKI